MSTLQQDLIQTTNGLSDASMQIVIDYVRTFIIPYDRQEKSKSQENEPENRPRVIGNRKGVRFFSEGHDIDDFDDEIYELLGVGKR